MKLSKYLTTMALITIMSLIYIQLQVQIYDLAYQGKSKELQIRKLQDDNGGTLFNICNLKSANHLGVKLLTNGSNMRFVDREHVVKLKTPDLSLDNKIVLVVPEEKQLNFLTKIFSLKSQAEAKTIR